MTLIVLECVCAVMAGARYWELSLDRELYFRSWIEKTSQLDCEGCPELPAKVEDLTKIRVPDFGGPYNEDPTI